MVGVSANDDSGEGCGKAHPGQTILRQHYLFVLWLGARALGCVLRCREVPLLSSLVDIREGCCLFAPPWGVLSLPTHTEVDPCLFTRGVKLLRWGALPLRSAQAGMSTWEHPLFSLLHPRASMGSAVLGEASNANSFFDKPNFLCSGQNSY